MLNLSKLSIMNVTKQNLQLKNIFTFTNKFSNLLKFNSIQVKFFTGKTETGWKYTTPTMRMKSIKPIYPPPGENLVIPSKKFKINFLDWSPKIFCERIGGDCHEVADKFENIKEIFTSSSVNIFKFNNYIHFRKK
jgi:hypothetical protein